MRTQLNLFAQLAIGTGRSILNTSRKITIISDNPRDHKRNDDGNQYRRIKVHKARLVKMGMSEEAVEKLQSDQLRALLRRPLETQKMIESAKVVAE